MTVWRLRRRVAKVLRWLATIAGGALLLVGCAWARSTFGDPPGPILPQYPDDSPGENQHRFGATLDAGCPVITIGVCIGDPIDGSPDEAGVWHYHATAGPCPEAGAADALR